jgi:ribosome maturation factor RimP
MFAFVKLPGLPRERILDAIAPVLRAHGLVGVELVWRTDSQGRVLQVTLEGDGSSAPTAGVTEGSGSNAPTADVTEGLGSNDSTVEEAEGVEEANALARSRGLAEPGRGVTLDLCARVSRDLSTALDVLELIEGKYRLEVGSPGLDRRLYTLADYTRFNGRSAKLKLASAVGGQYVLHGKLGGVDPEGRVLLVAGEVEHALKFEDVRSGQLVVDWQGMGFSPAPRQRAGRRSAAQGRK